MGFQTANSPLWTHYGQNLVAKCLVEMLPQGFLLLPLVLRGPGSRFRRVGGFGVVALKQVTLPCPHSTAQFGHIVEGLTLATAG